MSIFFDFEVGPSGRRFRGAVDDDRHDISVFVDGKSKKLFGVVDIGSLIELSTLSICMIGEDKAVQGFMALCDAPNVPGVDPADWENWIRNMYQKFYLSRGTLFIHFMCCAETVKEFFVEEAIVSLFDHDRYLNQIVLLVPPGGSEGLLWNPAVKKMNVYKYCAKRPDADSGQYLYVFVRREFCPRLKMRRAVEEDNDDIVEILDKNCPRLKEMYGHYYVSEIVGRHADGNRKIIVAEHQDRAVGVMCLNSDVNYTNLQANYELHPLYGLKKATPLEKEEAKRENVLLSTFGEPIMNGKWSPFQHMVKIEHIDLEDESHEKLSNSPTTRNKLTSKVNFRHMTQTRKSLEHIYSHHNSDDYSDQIYSDSPRMSNRSNSFYVASLLDEDPFDYEIVNIDSELLNIPEALSMEHMPRTSHIWKQRKQSVIQKRRQSLNPSIKMNESYVTLYQGEANAFMIELFGFHDYVHSRHAFDLLEAAFEVMKKYDYCIIQVPTKDKAIPLLQHFTHIPTKPNICNEYALYAAHRSSVLGKLRVRSAEMADIPQIANLLQTVDARETVWTIESSVLNKDQYQAYVLLSGLSVVGVGILEPPEQIDFIRAKFNLDQYHNHKYHFKGQGAEAGFGTLKVVIVYPVFEPHYRFFAREIMRFSGSSSLLWLTAYRNKWVARKANVIASAMIPLVPRKSHIDCVYVHDLQEMAKLSGSITAFSCWFLGRKMTSLPRVDINQRIVIVGASRTTMAFLDTLLFSDASSYLTFTNVTLVSPNGLPYTRQMKSAAAKMFPKYRTATDKYMKSVPYTYYTNIVQGTMVEINKRDKYIKLSNGSEYYYDLLFLLIGKQYQHPNYLPALYEREDNMTEESPYVRLDEPRLYEPEEQYLTDELPFNVFVINTTAQANHAVKYLSNFPWKECGYKVIVYGSSITAYCCLAALMDMNVPNESIIFVEPFPLENKTRVPIFCNVYVDQTVKEVLNNMNITVYRSYYFQSWDVDSYNMVTRVEFLSHSEILKLDCAAFFYYGKRGVSAQTLNAIKKSGLIYDGGILIDHEFRTKDPSIYACGPATRYYRRYFADSYMLKYYDSYEIGEKLGTQILNMLDPLFSPVDGRRRASVRFSMETADASTSPSSSSGQSSDHSRSTTSSISERSSSLSAIYERLPVFKKPIVTHCMLPGGLQYLDVRPPGKKVPHYFVQSLKYNGYVMETFKGGYFKLHLNTDYIVDGITCLSPDKWSLDNFKNLYGLSTTVLNNVHLRYTALKLDDFYEFFRSNWALYLYHDRVDELFAMAKELFPMGHRRGATLREALLSVAKMLSEPSFKFSTMVRMRSNLEQSRHVEAITEYVMEWVADHELPMYIRDENKTYYQRDLSTHPAFRKRSSVTRMFKKII